MKNTLFITILLFINTFIYSQQIRDYHFFYTDNTAFDDPPALPKYYKDVNNYYTPFLGTWKYTNGDKTFVVKLWKDEKHPYPGSDLIYYYKDNIYGHYKMVQDYGTANEVVLYTSEINIGVSITPWPTVIFAGSVELNKMGGHLFDINTEPANSENWPLRGFLKLTINPGTSPLTAHWKVTDAEEKFGNKNYTFVIPTDITLTKQ